jgi:hypothetical protein
MRYLVLALLFALAGAIPIPADAVVKCACGVRAVGTSE